VTVSAARRGGAAANAKDRRDCNDNKDGHDTENDGAALGRGAVQSGGAALGLAAALQIAPATPLSVAGASPRLVPFSFFLFPWPYRAADGLKPRPALDDTPLRMSNAMDTAVGTPVASAQSAGAGTGHFGRVVKLLLAFALLPMCVGFALGFWQHFAALGRSGGAGWSSALRALAAGAAVFVALAALLWRPVTVYVFAHELGHALATWLCLGRVSNLSASASGGQVSTSKSNTLIRLAPYCIPLYAIVAALVFAGLDAWWRPLSAYRWVLAAALGFTLAFHLGYTLWSLHRGQPDLKPDGWCFSLVVIFLANVLVVAAVLGLAFAGRAAGAWEAARAVCLAGWEQSLGLYRELLAALRHAARG
jgi:hypothetical protein